MRRAVMVKRARPKASAPANGAGSSPFRWRGRQCASHDQPSAKGATGPRCRRRRRRASLHSEACDRSHGSWLGWRKTARPKSCSLTPLPDRAAKHLHRHGLTSPAQLVGSWCAAIRQGLGAHHLDGGDQPYDRHPLDHSAGLEDLAQAHGARLTGRTSRAAFGPQGPVEPRRDKLQRFTHICARSGRLWLLSNSFNLQRFQAHTTFPADLDE